MYKHGSVLKKIRKNKGYSQRKIAGTLFSQSTYSNFESNKSDIHSLSFLHLLNQLQITSEEFFFIGNEYQYDKETEIKQQFFRLPYNDKQEISQVINSIDLHLKTNQSILLEELRSICEALLILETQEGLVLAQEKVFPIWQRISRYDQWYMMDIRIINVILYFFDNEVAIQVTNKLLERLKTYNDFGDAIKLSFTLKINLSLILIKNELYSEAFKNLEELLDQHLQKLSYQSLIVCYNRMLICSSFLYNEREAIYRKKMENLLEVYEDMVLSSMIQQEYKDYSNKKEFKL